jgi:hypothetical protein
MLKPELCANCKKPYDSHVLPTTQCEPGSTAKWFPQAIADALTKQQRRIKRAQRRLAVEHQHDRQSAS